MKSVTLYEKNGLTVTVNGEFSKEELEVLSYEANSTMSSILRARKYGGGELYK